MYHFLKIHSSVNRQICINFLAIVHSGAINMAIKMFLQHLYFISMGHTPSGIDELHDNSIFNILGHLHTLFNNYCADLYSHQECIRVDLSPHSHQHTFIYFFVFSEKILFSK